MHLQGFLAREERRFPGGHLGHGDIGGALLGSGGHGMGRPVDHCPGVLDLDLGIGQAVLHRLKAPDGDAELLALGGIEGAHVDEPLAHAQLLGRTREHSAIEGRLLNHCALGPAGDSGRFRGRPVDTEESLGLIVGVLGGEFGLGPGHRVKIVPVG